MPVSSLTPRPCFWPTLPPGHSCLFTVILLTYSYKPSPGPAHPQSRACVFVGPSPGGYLLQPLRPSLNKKPSSPAPPTHALLGFPELLQGNFQRAVLYAVPQLCPELQRNCGTTGTAATGTKPYGAGAAEGENWGPPPVETTSQAETKLSWCKG